MSIYEKNIESIKEAHEYMYSFIDKLSKVNREEIYTQSIDTKEESKALVVNVNGKTFRLNSGFKPTEEAKRWVEQFSFKNIGIVISMYGLGNGIISRELLSKLKDDELLIIYEPSKEIFGHVINNYHISDVLRDKRVYIIIEGINDNEFTRALWHNVDWANIKSQIICTHPKYEEMFPESYQLFNKLIFDNNERVLLVKDTEGYLSKRINENTIKNIKFIQNSYTISSMKKVLPKNIPAIIVASGPSLFKNIERLKKAKNKAVIISVDRAAEHLIEKDIVPDFIIAVDPIKELDFFEDEVISNIPLIFSSEANYMLIDKHKGKKILLNGHQYFNFLCKEMGKELSNISVGGSVSSAAFAICENIGFEKIILVGQDLAYTEGLTYAGDKKESNITNIEDIFVEDIFGNPIRTKEDWLYHLDWLNDAVDVVNYKKREVIDATEGGVKIKGTKIMTLKEAIDLYCVEEINIDNLINKMKLTFNEEEGIKEYIYKSAEDLDIIKQKSISSIEICNNLIEEYKLNGESDIFKTYNKKLIENNKLIGSFPVSHFLDTYIAIIDTEQLTDVYVIDEDEKENKFKTYLIAIEMYKANLDGVNHIKKSMESLLEEL